MPKFPFDLSNFEKISASDKKTTLKHKDGHFIVIAHGKLKPEMQKALGGLAFAKGGKVKKMADGGQVTEKQEPQRQPATSDGKAPNRIMGPPKPVQPTADQATNQQDFMDRAHQEFVQGGYAKGGKITAGLSKKEEARINRNMTQRSAGHDHPESIPIKKSPSSPESIPIKKSPSSEDELGQLKSLAQKYKYSLSPAQEEEPQFATGGGVRGEIQDIDYQDLPQEPYAEAVDPNSLEAQAPQQMPQAPQQPDPAQGAQPEVEAAPMPQEQAPAPQQPQAPMSEAPMPKHQASMQMPAEKVNTVNEAPLAKRSISAQMHAEDDALAQDLATGQINPKTYSDLYADKSTLGKIGTLFGLIAGGVGSGLTGQPNALLKMMDKTIERDLDAQKNSASNRQNFYKIRQQQLLNDAQNRLTKAQASSAEMANAATAYGLKSVGILPSGVKQDKNGKPTLTPAGEMQVRTQAKMDLYNVAAHDLEGRLAKMSPSHPLYAATAGALSDLKNTIAQEKQQMTGQVEKAHQAEEDMNDPIAKITGVSRSKLPPMPDVHTILHPDADKKIMGLSAAAAGSPMFKQTFEPLMAQYNAAKQTDEVLKDLPKTFQDLSRLRHWSQRLISPAAAVAPGIMSGLGAMVGSKNGGNTVAGGYLGDAAGEGVAQGIKAIGGTEKNRLYDAAVSKLGGAIMGARIPNLGHEEAMRWAHQYAPISGDSDEAVNWKLTQLADKIKMSVPRGLLDAQGFTQ